MLKAIKEYFFKPKLTEEEKARLRHEETLRDVNHLVSLIERRMSMVVWVGEPRSFTIASEWGEDSVTDEAIHLAEKELNSRGGKYVYNLTSWDAGQDQIIQVNYDRRVFDAERARSLYKAPSFDSVINGHLRRINEMIETFAPSQTSIPYCYVIHPYERVYPQRRLIREGIVKDLESRGFLVFHKSYAGTVDLEINWSKI